MLVYRPTPVQTDSGGEGGDGKLTSDPTSRARISFSISAICCSSAKARAQGTPRRRALVLSTKSALPPKPRVEVT